MPISDFPQNFQSVLKKFSMEREYTDIDLVRDISGHSGAHTYLVSVDHLEGRPKQLVLKIGKKSLMTQDLTGFEKAKKFFYDTNYPIETKIEDEDIICIPMELAGGENAITFDQFYLGESDITKINKVILNLFKKTLRRNELNYKKINKNVFKLYRLEDELSWDKELRIIGDAPPTLTFWWRKFGEVCPPGLGSATILSHCDLHSKNIIITSGLCSNVIDFRKTNQHHLMRDIVKLEREISLFLYANNQIDKKGAYDLLDQSLKKPLKYDSQIEDIELKKACLAIRCLRGLAKEAGTHSGTDWRLEYQGALLIHLLATAGNNNFNKEIRHIAFHKALRLSDDLKNRLRLQKEDSTEVVLKKREEFLARFAYIFSRLDQLPSGGWSKTLRRWMEAILEGDEGKTPRNPEIGVRGGINFTCYAFYSFCSFLKKFFPTDKLINFLDPISALVRDNLSARIGYEGGIGVGQPIHGQPSAIRLRHTALGLIQFLAYGEMYQYSHIADTEIQNTVNYLIKYLDFWVNDNSHLFGMFSTMVKLSELIKEDKAQISEEQRTKLKNKLLSVIPEMGKVLLSTANFDPLPKGTAYTCNIIGPFFPPINNFWRAKRSNFLMYFHFLISNDGENIISITNDPDSARINTGLQMRYIKCFERLLLDISIPYSYENPLYSLIHYFDDYQVHKHRHFSPPRDWGLSAELFSLLDLPAVRKLIIKFSLSEEKLIEKKNSLKSALVQTFDQYNSNPEIFKYTHGISYIRYLNGLASSVLDEDTLKKLNNSIDNLLRKGVTEKSLNDFINNKIAMPLNISANDVDITSIREMMVEKLESGEHTPDEYFCREDNWEASLNNVFRATIDFYDSDKFEEYLNNRPEPFIIFVTRIMELAQWHTGDGRHALDVGCGLGEYAKLLKDSGFSVSLVDTSRKMLKIASNQLGISAPDPIDLYCLSQNYEPESFDLIFASAVMVHVPRVRTLNVLKDFYQLLKPQGWLFINFDVKDHTLISLDNRYYEYYRDYTIPKSMLEGVGFKIEEIILRCNRRNISNDSKILHWANFFCRKY